ncbi:hypothetical protein QYE76_043208 [Lolium multiflorum]|uniref:Uncharacterized protein n=1 Tax=Lolium multiflorum TaxID=4521 RepID=A0AAD8TGT5_LOLMU|nr:hypothetical protein QYE76_043208 [Lolium multiflorum]
MSVSPPPPSPPPKADVSPPFIPPQAVNDAHNVFGDSSTTEFLSALNNSSVDMADGIPPFDEEIVDEEYDEEIGDEEVDEDVVEIEPGVAQQAKPRSSNYNEIEDVTLIRAWGKVGLDAVTGTGQTGKRSLQGKPEGTKKAKEMMKIESEASSFREKRDQMMKSRETLTLKTLETKLLITEKKKQVKLAKVEAPREEAKRKDKFDERMLALKETKAMKEFLAEEKEIMLMPTKDMNEDQLAWWKVTRADIMTRKRLLCQGRGASGGGASTPVSGVVVLAMASSTTLRVPMLDADDDA